jgi:hypothetical protein
MSQYADFVQDFPKRCHDILSFSQGQSVAKGREVTLSLMVASSAFLVPFERLRSGGRNEHPAKDHNKFPEAANKLNQLFERKFVGSEVWPYDVSSWTSGKLASIEGEVDGWAELRKPKAISPDKQVRSVLGILRNALAHGNIYTKGGSIIEALIFVSAIEGDGKYIGYRYTQVSPVDFRRLLLCWFKFLSTFDITPEVAFRAVSEAA